MCERIVRRNDIHDNLYVIGCHSSRAIVTNIIPNCFTEQFPEQRTKNHYSQAFANINRRPTLIH